MGYGGVYVRRTPECATGRGRAARSSYNRGGTRMTGDGGSDREEIEGRREREAESSSFVPEGDEEGNTHI